MLSVFLPSGSVTVLMTAVIIVMRITVMVSRTCYNLVCHYFEQCQVGDKSIPTNLISFVDSDVDYLPFIKLRNTTNDVKKYLSPADDTVSTDIDVPFGFVFGNISLTTVYVWLKTQSLPYCKLE